jgi:uncharacterized membrane protein
MYSLFKNNFVIGLITAMIVAFLVILDYRRKSEAVDTTTLFKIASGVFVVVSGVTYLSSYLHTFNKKIGGSSDSDLDTGLPKF